MPKKQEAPKSVVEKSVVKSEPKLAKLSDVKKAMREIIAEKNETEPGVKRVDSLSMAQGKKLQFQADDKLYELDPHHVDAMLKYFQEIDRLGK